MVRSRPLARWLPATHLTDASAGEHWVGLLVVHVADHVHALAWSFVISGAHQDVLRTDLGDAASLMHYYFIIQLLGVHLRIRPWRCLVLGV